MLCHVHVIGVIQNYSVETVRTMNMLFHRSSLDIDLVLYKDSVQLELTLKVIGFRQENLVTL